MALLWERLSAAIGFYSLWIDPDCAIDYIQNRSCFLIRSMTEFRRYLMILFSRLMLLLSLVFIPVVTLAAEVQNVQVFQEGNRAVFTYDLIDDETRE